MQHWRRLAVPFYVAAAFLLARKKVTERKKVTATLFDAKK
jgi:hypothetical protein